MRDPAAAGSGIPVAASTALRRTLTGAPQPAVVVGAPSGAIYVRTEDGELIAVLAPGAARLPMGAVVGNRDALRSRPVQYQAGQVGAGRIEAGSLSAYVGRWWDPGPVLPPLRPGVLAANLVRVVNPDRGTGLPTGALLDTLPALGAALHAGDDTAAARAASALVGLGPGLTPAGDDVLVGLLSALVCLGHPVAVRFAATLQSAAAGRTTDLSLALLRHASRGHCIGAVGALLRALAGAGDPQVAHGRLLAVGHNSGAALALGTLLGVGLTVRLAVAG